jgi:hypothetical protein
VDPATPVNDEVGLDTFPKLPPAPLTILQLPVPTIGVLAARFIVVIPHVRAQAGSGPALAVVGLGLTTTSTVMGKLGQPFAVPIIVNVVVIGAVVALVSVPLIVEPLPLAGIPVSVAVLFLVQLKVVPATLLGFVMFIVFIATPEHTV